MNLTEEKKGPLRIMDLEQKRKLVEKFFQGTGRVDFHTVIFLLLFRLYFLISIIWDLLLLLFALSVFIDCLLFSVSCCYCVDTVNLLCGLLICCNLIWDSGDIVSGTTEHGRSRARPPWSWMKDILEWTELPMIKADCERLIIMPLKFAVANKAPTNQPTLRHPNTDGSSWKFLEAVNHL